MSLYYSATFMEAQLCAGDEIIVVGGANSAGQAAVFLARTVRRIHLPGEVRLDLSHQEHVPDVLRRQGARGVAPLHTVEVSVAL